MESSSTNLCSICKLKIDSQISDITRLSCGHIFHSRCAHIFMAREYGYCAECLEKKNLFNVLSDQDYKDMVGPPSAALIVAKRDGSIPTELVDAHPLDFGDDHRLTIMLKKRLCLIRLISTSLGNGAGEGSDILHTTSSEHVDSIHPDDFNKFLAQQELKQFNGGGVHSLANGSNQDINSNGGIGESSSNSASKTFMSRVSNMFKQTVAVNFKGGSDAWLRMDHDPIQMFFYQRPIIEIIEKYGITSKDLIEKQVKIEALLDKGYHIDDLYLLGTTWHDLLSLYLTADVWQKHKTKLPIRSLCAHYHISVADIFIDVCHNQMIDFIKIGFSCDDLVMLKANAATLCQYGLVRDHMMLMGITMREWVEKLELTAELMIHSLAIQPRYLFISKQSVPGGTLTSGLGWLTRDHQSTTRLAEFVRLFPNYTTLVGARDSASLLTL
jgi:hypothetical protein